MSVHENVPESTRHAKDIWDFSDFPRKSSKPDDDPSTFAYRRTHTRAVCSFPSRNKAVSENSAKFSRKSGSSGGRFGTERKNGYNFLLSPATRRRSLGGVVLPLGHAVLEQFTSTPTGNNGHERKNGRYSVRTVRGWAQVDFFQIIFTQTVLCSILLLSLSSMRFVRSQ